MNWNQAVFPSLKRRGGCAIKRISRSNLSSRRRGGQIGEILRPEEFRRTSIEAAPYRACASRHPVCGAREAQARQRTASIEVASRPFINAASTPPFQGGECVRTETVCQFIHTCIARPYSYRSYKMEEQCGEHILRSARLP